jgi:hypothetical protein
MRPRPSTTNHAGVFRGHPKRSEAYEKGELGTIEGFAELPRQARQIQ